MSEQSKTGILILSYMYFTNPEIPVLVAHKENLTSKFKFKTHTSCQYKYISLSFSVFFLLHDKYDDVKERGVDKKTQFTTRQHHTFIDRALLVCCCHACFINKFTLQACTGERLCFSKIPAVMIH